MLIATGGTEITRRILPAVGFRPFGELCCFARPLRPFGQALTTAERNWRLPARFVRNTFWRLSPPLSLPRGWSAAPMAPDDVRRAGVAAAVSADGRRGAGRRLLPVPPGVTLDAARPVRPQKHGELAGYFCLAFAPHVARIADFWVPSTTVEDWCAAFRTAAAVAARAETSTKSPRGPPPRSAGRRLARAGFRLRDALSAQRVRRRDILEGRELHVQMLDCDAEFLSADEVSYLT